jgi:ATP phosphoribosyltransferase
VEVWFTSVPAVIKAVDAPGYRGFFFYQRNKGLEMIPSLETTPLVRLSLPSKGRLSEDSLDFLSACGLGVYKPNPRQYEAHMPALPDLTVLFQRPGDIVVSVRDGSVDFGITGLDVLEERKGENGEILVLHDNLGFGACSLSLAVPEAWDVRDVADLARYTGGLNRPLRVATKYPTLTARFLDEAGIAHTLISAEGTLETAPAIGYADIISDLVSSGLTLRDNRLRPLPDGMILKSQAALIGNMNTLRRSPAALQMARQMLEYFEAHLRARRIWQSLRICAALPQKRLQNESSAR